MILLISLISAIHFFSPFSIYLHPYILYSPTKYFYSGPSITPSYSFVNQPFKLDISYSHSTCYEYTMDTSGAYDGKEKIASSNLFHLSLLYTEGDKSLMAFGPFMDYIQISDSTNTVKFENFGFIWQITFMSKIFTIQLETRYTFASTAIFADRTGAWSIISSVGFKIK